MTVLAHTPAPWTVNVVDITYCDGVSSIAYVKADTGHREIAVLYDPIEQVANARLIASSPDLLQALRWVLPLAEQYLAKAPSHPDHAKLESARAAIVRAERQP